MVILAEGNPISWVIGSVFAGRFDVSGSQQTVDLHRAYRTAMAIPLEHIEGEPWIIPASG